MKTSWTEATLPTILSWYALKDIFNADEFSLFYQNLPSKTMHFKGQKYPGGKHSKVPLAGLAAGSTFGERLSIFVIGKLQKPRCFRGVQHLPCRYRS